MSHRMPPSLCCRSIEGGCENPCPCPSPLGGGAGAGGGWACVSRNLKAPSPPTPLPPGERGAETLSPCSVLGLGLQGEQGVERLQRGRRAPSVSALDVQRQHAGAALTGLVEPRDVDRVVARPGVPMVQAERVQARRQDLQSRAV